MDITGFLLHEGSVIHHVQACAWNQSTKKEVVLKGTADLFVRKRLGSSDNKNTDTPWRGKDERLQCFWFQNWKS